MPIQMEQPIEALSKQAFHDLDDQVMRLTFGVQNRPGWFYDEKIYRNELRRVCLINGIQANAEVKICLKHKTFKEDLFIDLLPNHGAIYELKTASAIASDYRIQTLDYLLLTETKQGIIVNLNTALYKKAICYFFEGQENIIQPVRITNGKTKRGSLKNGIPAYRKHLQQVLNHTNLDTLHWINLNGSKIQFSSSRNLNHSVPN
jgi:GxxExxY protein